MRFEKFVAADMRAALVAIKEALGPDAVIVATREISRGGLFRRSKIEVTAAIEDAKVSEPEPPATYAAQNVEAQVAERTQPTTPPQPTKSWQNVFERVTQSVHRTHKTPSQPAAQHREAATPSHAPETPMSAAAAVQARQIRRAQAARATLVHRSKSQQRPTGETHLGQADGISEQAIDSRLLAPLQKELKMLARSLKIQEHTPSHIEQELSSMRKMLASLSSHPTQSKSKPHEAFFTQILDAADVAPSLQQKILSQTHELCEALPKDLSKRERTQRQQQILKEIIADQMMTFPHFFERPGPRRIALAGPTGVGKTTTMAKIAAHAAIRYGQRVALITLDTYKIGAEEQAGHYARLIDVPLAVAQDARSFNKAMRKFKSYDLVLIDTAGRSPMQGEMHKNQLEQLFKGHDIQTYLILAGSTRWLELSSSRFELAASNSSALILTKLDEAVALGSCLNASYFCNLPIAFVTTGQRVPEDLVVASAPDLSARLVDSVLESAEQKSSHNFASAPRKGEGSMREQVA